MKRNAVSTLAMVLTPRSGLRGDPRLERGGDAPLAAVAEPHAAHPPARRDSAPARYARSQRVAWGPRLERGGCPPPQRWLSHTLLTRNSALP
jgi:hypothetical protein